MQADGEGGMDKATKHFPEIVVPFRGKSARDPQAPGRLGDFWPYYELPKQPTSQKS